MNQPREDQYRRMLLGLLPENEREALELHALEDPDLFERLSAVEDELVDARIRGELSQRDATRFDALLGVSPRIRGRMELARILASQASEDLPRPKENQGSVFWRVAAGRWSLLSAAAVLLLVLLGPLLREAFDRPSEGPILQIVLRSEERRGASSVRELSIPEDTQELVLYFEDRSLEAETGYRLELLAGDDGARWDSPVLFPVPLEDTLAVKCSPPLDFFLGSEEEFIEVETNLWPSKKSSEEPLATASFRLRSPNPSF